MFLSDTSSRKLENLYKIAFSLRSILDKFTDTALLLPMHKNKSIRKPLLDTIGNHQEI